jgi:hypothetical protein
MSWTAPLPVQRGKHVQGIAPVFLGGVDSTPPAPNYTPFFIIQRPSPDDPTTIQWAVLPTGVFGYGDVEDNPIDVSGVAATLTPTDDEWNDWDGVDGEVWLECLDVDLDADDIEDVVPDVAVNATCLGGDFDPTEDDWPDDDDNARLFGDVDEDVSTLQDQSGFKKWLATFNADDDGNLVIVMHLGTDIELQYDNRSTQPCIYPVTKE